jgi:hypothetical protein
MGKGLPPAARRALTERAREYHDPVLPTAIRLAIRVLGPFAPRLWPLSAAALKAKARARTGLTDFGTLAPLDEPLDLLCRSLDGAGFHAIGRLSAHTALLNSLVNRLRLEDLARRRPEVFERPVTAPLFIVGLQRSGTTFLQRLLAQDPGLRSIPFWEVMNPLPMGDVEAPLPRPDPRIAAGARMISFIHRMSPELVKMHEMENQAPDEELILLQMGFASMLFETMADIEDYLPWYTGTDHTTGYAYLKRVLQAMDWIRPAGERWLLKSPQHLEQFGPLVSIFPDGTFVQTHRDPVSSVLSLAGMMAYARRQNVRHPDPHAIGRQVADMTERLLRAAVRDRDPGDGRFVDVHFAELVSDPLAIVRRVYAAAERELTPEAEERMRAWLSANRRGRHGRHEYAAADVGLSVAELRDRFAFYYERFEVPAEDVR